MKFSTIFATALLAACSAFSAPLPNRLSARELVRDAIREVVGRQIDPFDVNELVARTQTDKTPTVAEIEAGMHIPKDMALFFSGPTDGSTDEWEGKALTKAKTLGKKWVVLSECLGEEIQEKAGHEHSHSGKFWDNASEAFAKKASGIVHVLLPKNTKVGTWRASGHWAKYEWPVLLKNTAVTKVIMIHPDDTTETVIHERK